jgi:hypothetical protein
LSGIQRGISLTSVDCEFLEMPRFPSVRVAAIAAILFIGGATLVRAAPHGLGCAKGGKPTTLDLSTGVATWALRGPGGVGPYAVVVTAPPVGWVPNQGGAQWVAPTADGDESAPAGRYVYRVKVNAHNCSHPGSVTLSGFIAADNGAEVRIDDNVVSSTVNYPYGFKSPNPTSFSKIPFPASGVHTVKIVMKNQAQWTGTLVKAVLTRTKP